LEHARDGVSGLKSYAATLDYSRRVRFHYLMIAALILSVLVVVADDVPKANEQRADGSIVLLATNAVTHGKQIRYEPQPHKNTIGYWTKAEDWVSWNFVVTKPGTFSATLTQACGRGSGGSEIAVTIGEQTIKDIVPDTGAFTNWIERTIGTFNLNTAGTYTITVKPLKKPGLAVMDLRAIKLTPKP
jgi:arylsulfatase A